MHGSHDPFLVVVSVLLAILASYTALNLVGRVAVSLGRERLGWVAGGALAMGLGIWSMHFTAMLAFNLPVPIRYHIVPWLLSILIAIVVSGVALFLVGRPAVGRTTWLVAGLCLGAAIAGMHYTGMAAIRVPGVLRYDPAWVAASLAIAITAAIVALWLLLHFRLKVGRRAFWGKIASAAVMGFAISGMHYTGMAAVTFLPANAPLPPSGEYLLPPSGLAPAVLIGSVVILGLALMASLVDRRLRAALSQTAALQASEARLRESEEHFRALIENAADLITILDAEGTNIYESPTVRRILGYEPEELIGTRSVDHIHPEDVPGVLAAMQRAIEEPGAPVSAEYRFRHKDGSWRILQSTGINQFANPAVGGIVVNSHDVTEQRHGEAALAESQGRFQTVLESLAEGILITDCEGVALYANSRMARITGYAPEELVGELAHELLLPPESHAQFAGETGERLRGASGSYEIQHIRKDGSRIWVDIHAAPVRDARGEIIGTVGAVTDITERRQASESLRESERRLREAQQLAGMGNWEWDVERDEIVWSDELFRIFDFEPGAIDVNFGVYERSLHPEDRDRILARIEQALADHQPFEFEHRIVHPGGCVRTISSNGQVLVNASGAPVRMRGTVQDITERKRADDLLRASEAEMRAVFGGMTDEVLVMDEEGRYLKVAPTSPPAAYRPPPGLQGRTMREVLPAEQAERFIAKIREVIQTQRTGQIEYNLAHYGRDIWFSAAISPMDERSVVWVARDISYRKRAEAALLQAKQAAEAANHAKSDFLSSMSHELRTPLNSVIGFANVLRKNKGNNLREQELSYLDRILTNGKHLLGLINDILDLSKIEAGKMEIELAPVSLERLVVDIVGELRGSLGGKDVVLRAAVPESMHDLDTDAGKLKQVIINLIGNAIKFTEQGSVTVSIAAHPESRQPVRIDVRDTGIGIPPERVSAIFDAFEQAESGTARRYGGTGLGLAISSSLSELLGFRLVVESSVGEGSTFSILLGQDQAGARPPPAGNPARSERAPERVPADTFEEGASIKDKLVLVIDDETDARMLLTHHLEELGCRTIAASGGEQGLRMAREFRPDLITLDLLLPETTGWEILRALKADSDLCDIPVIIVSMIASENRGKVFGAVDLLEKPIEQSELLAMLHRHMRPASNGRVLIVDDEADVRELLATYLSEARVEIRAAANGREALEVLDDFTPDLIVLDLMMPEVDGTGLLRRLRESETHRLIPVVVITAKDLSLSESRGLSRKTLGVLRKNGEIEADLRAIVQQVCRSGAGCEALPAAAGAGARETEA